MSASQKRGGEGSPHKSTESDHPSPQPDPVLPTFDLIAKKNRKLDINKAIEMRMKGLTYQDIADHFNCSKQAAQQTLAKYLPTNLDLKLYEQNRAKVYSTLEAKLLQSLTHEKLEKISAGSAIRGAGRLYDMHRLETGQSTENIAMMIDGSPAIVEAVRAASADYLKKMTEITEEPEVEENEE